MEELPPSHIPIVDRLECREALSQYDPHISVALDAHRTPNVIGLQRRAGYLLCTSHNHVVPVDGGEHLSVHAEGDLRPAVPVMLAEPGCWLAIGKQPPNDNGNPKSWRVRSMRLA